MILRITMVGLDSTWFKSSHHLSNCVSCSEILEQQTIVAKFSPPVKCYDVSHHLAEEHCFHAKHHLHGQVRRRLGGQ